MQNKVSTITPNLNYNFAIKPYDHILVMLEENFFPYESNTHIPSPSLCPLAVTTLNSMVTN